MKKIVGILTALIVIGVAVFCLLGGCDGFGNGSGNSEGSGEGSGTVTESVVSADKQESADSKENTENPESTESSKDSTADESSAVPTAEVTVSGRDYIYNNSKVSLDEFVGELKKLGAETEIRITSDETATKNTMDDLIERLENEGFKNYIKVE